jgi:hypothetical protein
MPPFLGAFFFIRAMLSARAIRFTPLRCVFASITIAGVSATISFHNMSGSPPQLKIYYIGSQET